MSSSIAHCEQQENKKLTIGVIVNWPALLNHNPCSYLSLNNAIGLNVEHCVIALGQLYTNITIL